MAPIPISVIIVSQNRPKWLRRCLIAAEQLDHPCFELIVVSCTSGAQVARGLSLSRPLQVFGFEETNISKARNFGIDQSSGQILAFIDDDAVPEPTWLSHLAAAFADKKVAQVGGTTLGRNGISVQHAASVVDTRGTTYSVVSDSQNPSVIRAADDAFPRLHGTNMAIRRQIVLDHGGFDLRFKFYLDDTDLTYRVSKSGGQTVHAPQAIVHHSSASSVFRNAKRVPQQLFEIGASAAVFHQKHTPADQLGDAKASLLRERRTWLLRHMQSGALTPDDVARLLHDLKLGYAAGLTRVECAPADFRHALNPLIPTLQTPDRSSKLLTSRIGNRRATRNQARELVQEGYNVTVFEYSYSTLFHRVRFSRDGYWLHTGGIFGREMRNEPVFQLSTRKKRTERTKKRLIGVRYQTGSFATN